MDRPGLMQRNPARTIGGSTVHAGRYDCECFGCAAQRHRGPFGPNVARWSCWRLGSRGAAHLDNGTVWRVCGTWIMCDGCRAESERIGSSGDPCKQIDVYLPLLHPMDVYARIAVEELLFSVAAFGASCAARIRVDSHPRCGFDVCGFGTRKTKNPCRARATQVAEDWIEGEHEDSDLYLCDRHAKTMKRRERREGLEFETSLVLDFGGSR